MTTDNIEDQDISQWFTTLFEHFNIDWDSCFTYQTEFGQRKIFLNSITDLLTLAPDEIKIKLFYHLTRENISSSEILELLKRYGQNMIYFSDALLKSTRERIKYITEDQFNHIRHILSLFDMKAYEYITDLYNLSLRDEKISVNISIEKHSTLDLYTFERLDKLIRSLTQHSVINYYITSKINNTCFIESSLLVTSEDINHKLRKLFLSYSEQKHKNETMELGFLKEIPKKDGDIINSEYQLIAKITEDEICQYHRVITREEVGELFNTIDQLFISIPLYCCKINQLEWGLTNINTLELLSNLTNQLTFFY